MFDWRTVKVGDFIYVKEDLGSETADGDFEVLQVEPRWYNGEQPIRVRYNYSDKFWPYKSNCSYAETVFHKPVVLP